MARIEPKPSVIKALFALSGNQCAFPGCENVLITKKGLFIGQLCHIEAANENGPRYNKHQSEEDRRSFNNLMLLCYEHHTEIDEDAEEYPVSRLMQIKKEHEHQFRNNYFNIPETALYKAIESIQIELDKLIAISHDTNQVVHGIHDNVNEILKRLPLPSQAEETLIYFEQLISTIKELKNQGKYETAIHLLLQFKEKNWREMNSEWKYKVLAHLGIMYLDIHQKDKAAEYLQAVASTGYETAESLSVLALGYAIDNKYEAFDACFSKAIKLDKDNVNLWVAYVERYKKEKVIEQIIGELPESIQDSAPMLFSIGMLLIDEGKKADGISFLKKSLQKHEDTPEQLSDAKTVIATQIMKDLVDPFKFVNKGYSEEELCQLEEAKILLSEAWDVIGSMELAQYKWHVILNRGVINKITGKLEQALSDFQKTYELSHEFIALKNLLAMYIQLERFNSAEQLVADTQLIRPLNEEETFELNTFKARLIFLQKDPAQGIQLMNTLLDEKNNQRYIETATHIIAMSIEYQQPDLGLPIAENLLIKFPDFHSSYLCYGCIWKAKSNKEKALEYFNKANDLLANSTSLNDIHILADAYIDLEQYEKAIPLFERLANKDILNDFSRGLIHAYFHFGDLQAAFALADHLFKRYPDNIYLAEIIGSIHQETKQYDKAIKVLEQFLPSENERVNDVFSYRCARLYSFKRDWENTMRWALNIMYPDHFELFEAFTLAWLFLESGDANRALEIAFDARFRFFDESDAHYNYVTLSTAVKKDEASIFPEEVRAETAVQVKLESGEEKTFLITKKNNRSENVLDPNNSFALQLIGQKKGSTIIITNAYGFTYSITIIGIMDIYTHAFQETLKLLETRFAGEHPIAIFHNTKPGTPGDPMEQLIKSITLDNKASEKELIELYTRQNATIGMIASINRRNQVMQLFALMSSHDLSVAAVSNNEFSAAENAFKSNIPIILDLTSLVTIFFIYHKQNLFSLLDGKFIVSESTVSELHACCNELNSSAENGLFTMTFEDGKLVGHMMPKEKVQEHQRLLKNITEWCEEHALILVSQKQLNFRREERKKYSDALGDSFFDTLLLSEEHQAAVISDDDHFKNFLRIGKTPLPFSTYSLAHWLLIQGKISMEDFDQFRTAIIYANYCFIPVTTEILWQCFEASSFQLRNPFVVAVKGLVIMLPRHCAQQLTGFLKRLYLANILATMREQVTLYVFREIFRRNDYLILKKVLIPEIIREFNLLPHIRKDILELLEAF